MVPHALLPPGPTANPVAPADWLEAWAHADTHSASHDGSSLPQAWLEALRSDLGAQQAVLAWYDRGHASIVLQLGLTGPASHWLNRLLTDALDESVDQGVCLRHPMASEPVTDATSPRALTHITRALEQATQALMPGGTGLCLSMPGAQHPVGAVLLCWAPGCPPAADVQTALARAVRSVAPLMHLHRLSLRPWHWHLRQAMFAQWTRWWHPQDKATRRWRLVFALAALSLLVIPWPHKLGGQARIEGIEQRVLSAPTDGFVKAAHALPGDRVKQGQVLLDLVDQDLRLERERWLSQIAQFDNAYAAAMTRGDRAEASIGLSRLEEAQSQLALVDEQLQRSQLKSPFDGVVIQGDLSHAIGVPVKQGDALITVASEEGHRVIIDIDEGDIGLLHAGQRGGMALSALPWQTVAFNIRRITPQAVAKEGRNVYEVEAAFEGPLPEGIRPGLMGAAKVQVGHQPLMWSWLRPVVNKLRLWWWAWAP